MDARRSESPAESQHLLLATRQQTDLALQERPQLWEQAQRNFDRLAAKLEVIHDGKIHENASLLGDVPQSGFGPPVQRVACFPPEHADVPARRSDAAAQRSQGRGLAGAVRADQRDDLTLVHTETHIPQHGDRAVPGVQGHRLYHDRAATAGLALRLMPPTAPQSECRRRTSFPRWTASAKTREIGWSAAEDRRRRRLESRRRKNRSVVAHLPCQITPILDSRVSRIRRGSAEGEGRQEPGV